MKRIISALVMLSLLLAGQSLAAEDSVVFEGGDVRIKGIGNGLVFPNGSRQTVAADGISKSVHGTVVGASVPNPGAVTGTGYSVSRTILNSVGTYEITFSPAFSNTPDCVISPVGHSTTININYSFIDCELSTVSSPTFSTHSATVECKYYNTSFPDSPKLRDATFTFICVD
jgi:hypothetical protein